MSTIIRIVILILAVGLFIAGVGLAYKGMTDGAVACFAAAVITLIFVFLTQFKRFKGLGVEAELWEQEMENAERIIRNLKTLSHVVSEPIVSLTMRTGRMGAHSTRKEQYDLVSKVERILEDTGIDQKRIEAVKKDFIRYAIFDVGREIYEIVKSKLKEKFDLTKADMEAEGPYGQGEKTPAHQAAIKKHNTVQEAQKSMRSAFEFDNLEDYPDIFEKAINECEVFTEGDRKSISDSICELVADIHHLKRNGKIRRLDAWLARDTNK